MTYVWSRDQECGCTPGTPEDGWQEVRSDRCAREDREALEAVIARYLEINFPIHKDHVHFCVWPPKER